MLVKGVSCHAYLVLVFLSTEPGNEVCYRTALSLSTKVALIPITLIHFTVFK